MPLIPEVKYDQVLTNIALAYEPEGYIADQVMPVVPVKNEDGVYWVYDKSKFFTPQALRAPRTRYREIDWSATRDSYHAEEYGLETRIDDRERNNSASPLDLDETGTETLVDMIFNNREKRIATMVLSTGNVTQNTTLAGATQWSDAGGGDPIGVAMTAHDTIRAATGIRPNSAVMGYSVWSKLQQNPKIMARLPEGAQVTEQVLKTLFQVDNLYIGSVLTATSKKGQTVTLGDVWGKDVLFFHKQNRPALRRPAFGYQMQVAGLRTFRWRDTPVNCDVIRVNEIRAEKMVAASLGYLVKAAVA
jgi:hypothetical protein